MPNGRPGDHPITDMLVHGKHPFPRDMEALMRELDAIDHQIFNECGLAPFEWAKGKGLEEGRQQLKALLVRCRKQAAARNKTAMTTFQGKSLSWMQADGTIELELHRPPGNEMGSEMLEELERFVEALEEASGDASALIIHSRLAVGFSAGADLRELYKRAETLTPAVVREFLERIHRVMNTIDESSLVTIAAVHGVCFGGGFELALACDLIIADKMARFCFPELRLGLIPGFGGIPRLKRDLGNGVVRDLLLTGRSINATKAQAIGLVSQVTAEGEALRVARATAAQVGKFDATTRATAKRFVKPIPHEELRREIEIFCELFTRPAVMEGLRKFVESTDALPYLP